MLDKKKINLKISANLKEKISLRAADSGLVNPLPGIILGEWDEDNVEKFTIGFYDRHLLPVGDPVRIIEADGMEFLIIQDWLCTAFEGKIFDLVDNQLTLLEQS